MKENENTNAQIDLSEFNEIVKHYTKAKEILNECFSEVMHKVIRERRDTISYIIDKWANDLSLYALNEKAYKINLNLLNEHFEIMFKDLDIDIILYARKALFDLSSYHFSDIPPNYYVFFDTLYTACDFEYKLIQQEIKKEKQKRKYKHSQIMLN